MFQAFWHAAILWAAAVTDYSDCARVLFYPTACRSSQLSVRFWRHPSLAGGVGSHPFLASPPIPPFQLLRRRFGHWVRGGPWFLGAWGLLPLLCPPPRALGPLGAWGPPWDFSRAAILGCPRCARTPLVDRPTPWESARGNQEPRWFCWCRLAPRGSPARLAPHARSPRRELELASHRDSWVSILQLTFCQRPS